MGVTWELHGRKMGATVDLPWSWVGANSQRTSPKYAKKGPQVTAAIKDGYRMVIGWI